MNQPTRPRLIDDGYQPLIPVGCGSWGHDGRSKKERRTTWVYNDAGEKVEIPRPRDATASAHGNTGPRPGKKKRKKNKK